MDARRHESEEVLYVSAGDDDDSHRRLRRHGSGEKRARREGRGRDLGRQVYGRRGLRSDDGMGALGTGSVPQRIDGT